MTKPAQKRACIKRGPKKFNREQELANAAELRLKMLELLKAGSMSVREMGEALECKPSTLRDYLHRMTNEGLVSSVIEKGYGGAPTAAIYSLGNPNPHACNRASQHTVTSWTPNLTRDPLVSFLFGAPGAGVAA